MEKSERINFLKKEAAKKSLKVSPLNGKVSRKDINKHLIKIKEIFTESSDALRQAKAEAERISKIIEENASVSQAARKEMARLYEVMHNMDLSSSTVVRLNGQEVLYAINGKWHQPDADGTFVRRTRNQKNQEIETSEFPSGELLDADDGGDLDFLDDLNLDDGSEIIR